MLVGSTGLSLDAVLGVVRAYPPRFDCGEGVGADDLDLDSVLLVVQADDLQAFQIHILGCFLVRVGEHTIGALSLHMNDWIHPSNDLELMDPTLS
jgi:hypothetical protein